MKRDLDSIILTRQELQIMKVLWERGSATVKDVCDVISQIKTTAYTTILTMLEILEHKGALAHTISGRAFVFKPLLSRQQATRNQVHDLLIRFFDGNPGKLIESILEYEVKELEQIGAVRDLLELRQGNQAAWQNSHGAAQLGLSGSDAGV